MDNPVSFLPAQPGVVFDEKSHTYVLNGKPLPSVTTRLKAVKPVFDSDGISRRVAAREGRSQQDVLDEWWATSDAAIANGKRLHGALENILLGESNAYNSSVSLDVVAWMRWWLPASKSMTPVAVEYVMADSGLGVAGTLDALFVSSKTKLHHVFDWKTGKNFRTVNNYNQNLLKPFDDLPDCEMSVYSLQVSVYRLMLERRGIKCGDSWVVHMRDGVVTPHRMMDYRRRVEGWLVKDKQAS